MTDKINDELEATNGNCYGLVNELAEQLRNLDREGGKHDFSDYTNYANLSNALRSVFALACLTYKVYGAGVAVGKPQWYQLVGREKRYYTINTSVSRLFSNNDGRFFYTLD